MPGEEDVSPKDRDIEIGDSGIRETSKSLALFGSLGFVVMLMGVAVVALYKFGK